MTWRAKMQPASFRGAGFLVEDADGDVGRRLAVHEYPMRDLPYAEDLGRKARIFKVTGLVIGADYMAQRDALLAACEQPGPGTLVHPFHGTMEVICQVCTYREELRAGGKAAFSLTFMEAGQRHYPTVELDFSAQAVDAANTTRALAGDVFAQVYQLTGPAWLAAAAAGDLKTALTLVQAVTLSLPSVLDSLAVGQFLAGLESALGQADTAAGAAQVAANLTGAIEGLAQVGGEQAVDGLMDLADFGAPNAATTGAYGTQLTTVVATTATRQVQADNQTALTSLVRRLAISCGVEQALAAEYQSYEAGQAARDQVLTRLDEEMLLAGDQGQDEAYQALRGLYASTNQAFSAKLAGLAKLKQFTLQPAAPSALALAYDLYGDLARAEQIVALNNLPHPGLLPAGDVIQVLNV